MKILRTIKRQITMVGLSRISRNVVHGNLTYLSPDKLKRIERALSETSNIPGDIIEFGVALGGSGIILAHHASPSKRFIGLDVFAMIPPPTSDMDDKSSKDRYEVIASGASDGISGEIYYGYRQDLLTEVEGAFAKYGVPLSENIVLLKGLFQDTWPLTDVRRISLAHIDCDWYDPVKYCLEACADKLSRGGILVIDDYNDYSGCRAAVDEFVKCRPDFSIEHGDNPFLRKR